MATRPFNGNYLNLEDVRISYDKRSDTVHITSKDEDLTKDSNFKLSLNNGKSSDIALRNLLRKHGLIPPLETMHLPNGGINLHDRIGSTDYWHTIPLGVKDDGSELVWNPADGSNLFLYGRPGMGKSGIHRLIMEHANNHKDTWEVLGFSQYSLDNIDYQQYENNPGIVLSSSLELFMSLLRDLEKELEERHNIAKYINLELSSVKKVFRQDKKSIILVIDEMDFFDTPVEIDPTDENAIQKGVLRAEAMAIIPRLLHLGSHVRIHVVLTQTNYTGSKKVLAPRDKDLRMNLGDTDEESSFNIFGSNIATVSPGPIGRGYSKVQNEENIFQLYYTK